MTIKQLHTATAQLGFEDELESSDGFFAAANRALYCANRIRPHISVSELVVDDGVDTPETTVGGKGYVIYDTRAQNPDFLCYAPCPVTLDFSPLVHGKDYILTEDDKLLLPYDAFGTYRIRYFRTLKEMTIDDESARIDLPEDVCQILPLLVASYVWLEDEPEKAETYKALFYSEAQKIKDFSSHTSAHLYDSDEGWCN